MRQQRSVKVTVVAEGPTGGEEELAASIDTVSGQVVSFEYEVVSATTADRRSPAGCGGVTASKDFVWFPMGVEGVPRREGVLQAAARLVTSCRGQYLALLSRGDSWDNVLKLQMQVEYLDANPKAAMCFHEVRVLGRDGDISERIPRADLSCPGRQAVLLKHGLFLHPGSVVVRRKSLEGLPPELPEWTLFVLCTGGSLLGYIDGLSTTTMELSRTAWRANSVGDAGASCGAHSVVPAGREVIAAYNVMGLECLLQRRVVGALRHLLHGARLGTDCGAIVHDNCERLRFLFRSQPPWLVACVESAIEWARVRECFRE